MSLLLLCYDAILTNMDATTVLLWTYRNILVVFQTVEEVSFAANGITAAGIKAFDGVLQSNIVLKTLDLSGNPIGDEGVKVSSKSTVNDHLFWHLKIWYYFNAILSAEKEHGIRVRDKKVFRSVNVLLCVLCCFTWDLYKRSSMVLSIFHFISGYKHFQNARGEVSYCVHFVVFRYRSLSIIVLH